MMIKLLTTIALLLTGFLATTAVAVANPTADAYDESHGLRDVLVTAIGPGGGVPPTHGEIPSGEGAVATQTTARAVAARGPIAQVAGIPFTPEDAGWFGLAAATLATAGAALVGTGVVRRRRLERYDDV